MNDYIDMDDYDDDKYLPKYVTMRVNSVTNFHNDFRTVLAEKS